MSAVRSPTGINRTWHGQPNLVEIDPKRHLHEPLRGLESKRLARNGKSHDGSVFIGARNRSGVPASKLKALGRRNRGDTEMAETAAYPYATHLDIKFDPLTLIDVSSLAKTVTDQWYNQTLCKVNEIRYPPRRHAR